MRHYGVSPREHHRIGGCEAEDGEPQSYVLQAQTHIFNHIFSFINSMSLKCAIELCIPDVIHKYGQPMPLSLLIASLPIHPSKTGSMNHFLQLNDQPLSMTSFLPFVLDPTMINPWQKFSTWFKNDDPTPFYTENGMTLWDYACHEPKFNHVLNEAMASDARLISNVVVEKCEGVFMGLESLVDVGGGTGTMAKAIAKSFPQLECIVFDLPHVVNGLQGSDNLKYVGGDMFESIPSADSILLKWILHDWNDEECVKILKKCKEALTSKGKEGKVIIIEVVMGNEEIDGEFVDTKLFFDMEMMALVTGKERNEKEWAKLFFSAGFSNYKITQLLGLKSLIEVYP
ncbi:probable O-methyltransferase 3 [Gastrolobium bilobum]|uniref:probable O-methyltransferase 3 n=1 Tax=Gastrolobium bilobum TaxID=150636 RepID=UPI002AB29CCD|nr:probable O-methyltransferase 3 [Gastrolobium bilobum]